MKPSDSPSRHTDLEVLIGSFDAPAEEGAKPVRSGEELRRVRRKMIQMARVYADDNLTVLPGDWWRCGFPESGMVSQVAEEYLKGERATLDGLPDDFFRPRHIFYPEKKLYEETEDEIDGKMDHEAGHALHTDFRWFFEMQKKAIDGGNLPSTACSIVNAEEDPFVNNRQIGISDYRKRRFKAVYRPWIERHKEKMKNMPVSSAVETLVIAKWIQERLGFMREDEFQEMYMAAADKAREYFDRLLIDSRNYWSARDNAEKHRIFEEKIWPVYRELEVKAEIDQKIEEIIREAVRRMKEQMQQGQDKQKNQDGQKGNAGQMGSGGGIPIPLDKLPQDLQDEINDLIKAHQQSSPGEPGQSDQPDKSSKKPADSPKEGREGDKSSKPDGKTANQPPCAGKPDKQDGADGNQPSVPDCDVPKPSDDLKGRILKAIDGDDLNEEDKKNLKKAARTQLDRRQAEHLNDDGLPGGTKMEYNPKTGQYEPKPADAGDEEVRQGEDKIEDLKRQTKEEEAKIAEARKKIEEALRPSQCDDVLNGLDKLPEQIRNEIRKAAETKKELLKQQRRNKLANMRKEGFLNPGQNEPTPEDEAMFDELKEMERAVRPGVERFVNESEKFIPKKEIAEAGDHRVRSGTELDNESLGDFGARVQGYVFKNMEIVEQGDPRIVAIIVCDRSGSMEGEKMRESKKTALFYALALKELSIRCGRPIDYGIIFFDDKVSIAKDPEDDFNSPNRKTWPDGAISTVRKRFIVEANKSGSTDMGAAIVLANRILNRYKKLHPQYMSLLTVIGDAETFGALSGEKLTRFIRGIEAYRGEKMGRHLMTGIFLRGSQNASAEELAKTTPMEQYFGPRDKGGTIVVDDFKGLVPQSSKVLRKGIVKITKKGLYG